MAKERIFIYCAHGFGERIAYALPEEKYDVLGFIDDDNKLWDQSLFGFRVYPPAVLLSVKYDKILISIGEYEQKIRDCLISKYGVNDSQIVTYRSGMEGFCWEEERIIALRKCITLIKERNVLGDMAEVGVYTGEFAKLFNRYLPERRLYLFDTFEGFDSSRDEIEDRDKKIFKDTSVELVLSKMKTPENCIVRKGYFPDTAKGVDGAFSLVSLDCDLYNPILAGLTFFYPR